MKRFWVSSLTLTALSCKSEYVASSLLLEANFIVKQNIGCGLPMIEFTKEIEQTRKVANVRDDYEYQGYFLVYGLDSTYWQPGRRLNLTIRPVLQPKICEAMGAWYPQVKVESVQ